MKFKNLAVRALIIGVVLPVTQQAAASGFALIENSASGQGNAFAGAAAVAEDASTIFFNPAGMMYLDNPQAVVAAHSIDFTADFTNDGSTLNAALGGGAISGVGRDDGGESSIAPNIYYSNRLNEKWAFGIGVSVPFGLKTDYNPDWVGRYHALTSELKTVNINPALAYRLDDRTVVGFGINAQYIDATLSNAIDSGAVCYSQAAPPAPATCNPLTLTPGNAANDSSVSLSGDDTSYGWNFGLMFDVNDRSRVGFSYRSKIAHSLSGTADFTTSANFATFLTAAGSSAFQDTGVKVDVQLPASWSLSTLANVNPQWDILADLTWTEWSEFDQLVVEYDNPAQANTVLPENWENTTRVSLGTRYRPNARWVVRVGVAYDESPIPSDQDRTARIPGNDRRWASIGFGYQPSDALHFDFGYSHLFISDTRIENTDPSYGHVLRGDYDAAVDIISAQANWNF